MQLTALFTMPRRATKMLAMKLMAIMLVVCLQVSAGASSQTVTYSAKNARLETVFNAIRQQTGYVFFYKANVLKDAKPVNLDVKNAPIERVLQLCLDNQGLGYTIEDKTIVIAPKEAVKAPATNPGAVVAAEPQTPPTIDVKGRVVNEKGEPVIASVQIKGTKRGVSTNEQGYFELKGVDENAVLVVSGVNIETIDVKVSGRSELSNVVVKNKIVQGEEVVVVNTGYQRIPKERATGSFSQPDKQTYDRRISTDVVSKLEGITSGLVFNRSANGSLSNLNIRGLSTIFSNIHPLIVIDNFPYDGDINNINPNDVETVTLLRDAAAASIWGARAGNGVLVITTKSAKYGQQLRTEVASNFTIGTNPDLFYDKRNMSSSDFMELEKYFFNNHAYDFDLVSPDFVPVSPLIDMLNQRRNFQISAADSAAFVSNLVKNDIRRDISKFFYQKEIKQQYAINLRGGDSNANYLLSFGHDRNRSMLVGNNQQRFTVNSLFNMRAIKCLELTVAINAVSGRNDQNSTLSELSTGNKYGGNIYPYAQLKSQSGNDLPIVKDFNARYADTVGGGNLQNFRYYPLKELQLADNIGSVQDFRILTGLKYHLTTGLSAEIKYQFQKFSNRLTKNNEGNYFARRLVNIFTTLSPGGNFSRNIPEGAIVDNSNTDIRSNRIRAQLNYESNWRQNRLTVLAGAESGEVRSEVSTDRTYGFNRNTLTYANVDYNTVFANLPTGFERIPDVKSFEKLLNRTRSFFINGGFSHKEKYMLTASARLDQSNLFGVKTNQKSVPLWSVGGQWSISKEKFYSLELLPLLQLRVTYGYSGNVNTGLTAYLTSRYEQSSPINNSPYATIISPGNPELKWERVKMYNFAVDFGFRKQRVAGGIDFYFKRGLDLIGDAPLPSSTAGAAFLAARGNFSALKGKGVDFSLGVKAIDKVIKWDINFLISYATDKITDFYGVGPLTSSIIVDRPVNYISSYPWAGLNPNTGAPRGILGDTISQNYSALVSLLPRDQIYNGPANPTFYGGVRNTVRWRKISISANISFKGGYYFRRTSLSYSNFLSSWNGHQDYNKRWMKPGDLTQVPALTYPLNSAADAFYNNSEVTVEKGDHIRLQDVIITHEITKKSWLKMPFSSLRLTLQINNIGLLWKHNKLNIDPDQTIGVLTPVSYSFGFNATF